jgi:hypothetical protein
MVQDAAGRDRMVRPEVAGQRLGQLRDPGAQLALGQVGEPARVTLPAISASTMAHPD